MIDSSTFIIQEAIYSLLNGNINADIVDDIELGNFPKVYVGENTETDWDDKIKKGSECTHTLHIFSDYRGYKEVKQISGEIKTLLTNNLTVAGYDICECKCEMNTTIIEGNLRHGVMRFRIKIKEV